MTSEELATLCAGFASEKQAEDIAVLDLRGISTFTDFFVICSAASEPQIKAIAGEIENRLRTGYNRRPTAVDGNSVSQWMIIDFGDVVVHVFHQAKRELYSLEDLWSDAPRVELKA